MICLQRPRKRWWLILIAVPILTYAGLIVAAYSNPPLYISALTTNAIPQRAAVIEVQNHGRWPLTLTGVKVKGVLPPDEVGALMNVGGVPAQVTLLDPVSTSATGDLVGWKVGPGDRNVSHGIKLVWYQKVDLRWLNCATVHYRYLLWPMTARSFCDEELRGASSHSGPVPAELGEWGPWQSVAGGVRYRTQRLTQERGDELWIEMEPDEGAPQIGLTLNRFAEAPAEGHARFHLRIITMDDRPAATVRYTVPLRWGEPTPEVELEVVSFRDL